MEVKKDILKAAGISGKTYKGVRIPSGLTYADNAYSNVLDWKRKVDKDLAMKERVAKSKKTKAANKAKKARHTATNKKLDKAGKRVAGNSSKAVKALKTGLRVASKASKFGGPVAAAAGLLFDAGDAAASVINKRYEKNKAAGKKPKTAIGKVARGMQQSKKPKDLKRGFPAGGPTQKGTTK